MTVNLGGSVALVTGSGRGIGKSISIALAEAGARVILCARTFEEIKALETEIVGNGHKATAIKADISEEDDVKKLFGSVRSEFGRLDILVNNAGIGIFGEVVDFPIDQLDKILKTNVRGTFLCCQHAVKIMIPQKSGYIFNISSVAGVKGYPNHAAYAASKHAVMGITKTLANEVNDHGIRVSAILPGGVDTELIRSARPDIDHSNLIKPEDVSLTVLYLLSLSESSAVDQIQIRRRSKDPFQ